MNKPLYQHIALTLEALRNCEASGNTEWARRHRERVAEYENMLPSGSGFDTGTRISIEESTPDKLVLVTSYHHMDEHGTYDGWTDHKIVITPSLAHGFSMKIGGRDRNDIKDYIGEVYDCDLRQSFNPFEERAKPTVH